MTEESIEKLDDAEESKSKKRRMYVGLDLGTLNTCILTKLSKSNANESEGILVPVVGYPEEGILAGILREMLKCCTVRRLSPMNCICAWYIH